LSGRTCEKRDRRNLFEILETNSLGHSLYEIREVAAYVNDGGASKLDDTAALRARLSRVDSANSPEINVQRDRTRIESEYATSPLGVGFGR
jgi:hypothetical protein